MLRAVALAFCVLSAPAWARDGARFALPIACEPGTDCFVQNYVDQDASEGYADFACGSLSYDGHDGTDIRLPNLVAMERGVAVLAAADGQVIRTRDGMADVSIKEAGAEAVEGREAGNGVIIDHGDGWETQYSHLKMGSVLVEPGQGVEAGDPIGLVGLSGDTEFPHLEFVIRHDGAEVDPFVGRAPGSGCGRLGASLWTAEAEIALAYRAGGLLSAGFATEAPEPERAREGAYDGIAPLTSSEALVFWVDVFGTRAGDRETIRLIGPDGSVIAEATETHERNRAQWFRFIGKRAPEGGWPAGAYRGTYALDRVTADGTTIRIAPAEAIVTIAPPQ
jgi:hypothetical protein